MTDPVIEAIDELKATYSQALNNAGRVTELEQRMNRLESTPVAFNWTDEMSAIWPAEYRPTMSGLLAIWEAMRGAAVYDGKPAADAEGWIPHKAGDPMPCDGDMMVDVRFQYGAEQYDCPAGDYCGAADEGAGSTWWLGKAGDMSIVAWRPARSEK